MTVTPITAVSASAAASAHPGTDRGAEGEFANLVHLHLNGRGVERDPSAEPEQDELELSPGPGDASASLLLALAVAEMPSDPQPGEAVPACDPPGGAVSGLSPVVSAAVPSTDGSATNRGVADPQVEATVAVTLPGAPAADSSVAMGPAPASSTEAAAASDSPGTVETRGAGTDASRPAPASHMAPVQSGAHVVAGSLASEAPAVQGTGRAAPVTDQVFGQVSRLVSRGDGTHRMMLRLHPADLGEVKVVLTARAGVVDVTLSAAPEAGAALRAGSSQLRSLLEIAGATGGQIVVRDLVPPSTATPPTHPGSSHLGGDPGSRQDTPRGGSGDERAGDGTREDGWRGHGGQRAAPSDAFPFPRQPGQRTTSRLDLDL